jgi:uncharacterized membrane protein
LGWINAGTSHGIKATTGGITDIGSTVANRSTRLNAANNDANVVVGWQDGSTGFRQGAMWVNGTQTLVVDGGGLEVSELLDVDAAGVYAVGGSAATQGFVAYRWSIGGGFQSLGTIFNPSWRGAGTSVSDDGKTVVGYYRQSPGPATLGEGFIWVEGLGMQNLTTYVTNNGVALPTGWVLSLPLAISGDGTTFAGLARTPTGNRGFVVSVPEPASMGAIGVGGLAVLLRRRRAGN